MSTWAEVEEGLDVVSGVTTLIMKYVPPGVARSSDGTDR